MNHKAYIHSQHATRYSDGRRGTLSIYVDLCGISVSFEDERFTYDDSLFVDDMFAAPGFSEKLAEARESEFVFEAGAEIEYEGLYDAKLFRNFLDACDHAESVTRDEWMTPVVKARKLQ